ncbi:MAG TPA: hypothetical protein VGO52_24505 [Hyphomonadaceae bacterium]|jgi:hypothetical protein|nr:hypothetical protein [Hyphomonadaceae bacterium]
MAPDFKSGDSHPGREPLLRRRHLLRSKAWVLSTGAVVLLAVIVVAVITALNGGFAPAP